MNYLNNQKPNFKGKKTRNKTTLVKFIKNIIGNKSISYYNSPQS